jgi:ribonuclease-3
MPSKDSSTVHSEILSRFSHALDISFANPDLLLEAVTHRSYLNEHRGHTVGHNERLEFLGDAVLELAVTAFLFKKYPENPEGELTAYRAALVNTQSLSSIAESVGVNDVLLLSKGEAKDTGRARQYLVANALEAIIGALYLDKGYGEAERFIARHFYPRLEEIVAKRLWQDAKSRFQEFAQEHEDVTPSYRTLFEEGPDHDKHFTVGVFLGNDEVARGVGKSKQEAEQAAAGAGLTAKGW